MIRISTTEKDDEYDGFLSYSAEIHMATIGFGAGFFLGQSKTIREELNKEPQYFIGFLLFGWMVGILYKDTEK